MRLTRLTLAAASSVLLLATLSACGGDDASGSGTDTAARGGDQTGQQGTAPGLDAGMVPGASGEVAAVSGRTAQVQNDQTGQVAVSWTGDTTFTQEVDATLDAVEVGSCVVVTTADTDDSSAEATEVTAASVRITPASDDGCGFGGGRGAGMPSGAPSDLPSDMPSDMPTDRAGGMPGGFGTVGEVMAVSATGFTVAATTGPPADDASAGETSEVSVTVTGDTTYTATATATAAAVEVGRCLVAQGDADDTGAVTAASVSISDPVDGSCTSGFGMRGPLGGTS